MTTAERPGQSPGLRPAWEPGPARWPGPARRLWPGAALYAVAVLAAAGCGSGGHPAAAGGSASHKAAQPAGQALALAAAAAGRVKSFTATLAITSSGSYRTRMSGTLAEQRTPVLLVHQSLAVSAAGQPPQTMQTLLTGNAAYLKLSSIARLTGKPWTVIPYSALKKRTGASLAPLIRELQGNDPLAQSQMLAAAKDVREVGTATVAGVTTTGYTGTLNIRAALAKVSPALRKLLQPTLAATGITTARFTVWVDSQHEIRKLAETESGASYHVTTEIEITSINQPVHITVPPASQVASFPGL
jgi:hypothetical protein